MDQQIIIHQNTLIDAIVREVRRKKEKALLTLT